MLRWFALISVSLALLTPAALAQPSEENSAAKEAAALALYKEGEKLYQNAQYEDSAAKYLEGYEISKKPGFLYNIAQAYRLANDCVKALDYYLLYLEKGSSAQAERKTRVAELIGQIRPCAEKQRNAANPVNTTVAEPETQAPPITAPPNRVDDPSDDSGSALRWVSYATGALGVAFIGTGVFFGLDAADKSDQVTEISANGGQWTEEAEALQSDGKRSDTLATTMYIAGGLALAASVTLFVLSAGDDEDEGPVSGVAVAPTRGGAAMIWRGSF